MNGRELGSEGRRAVRGEARAENSFQFLVLAMVAAVFTGLIYAALAAGYILMVRDPGHGFRPSAETAAEARKPAPANTPDDPSGTSHLTFVDGLQAYFYRTNNHAGNILILTGKVRNNYPESRSFIRLRGHLLSSDEKSLADRFGYAGNFLSEDDLVKLPIAEITARLQIKGGRNNSNVNIPPGGELPFMLVFDNVPDGVAEYRLDPVWSNPAQ